MKITVCGSIAFIDQMMRCKKELEQKGFEVFILSFVARDKNGRVMDQEEFYRLRKSGEMELSWFEVEKSRAIEEHFNEIATSDAILVANYEKNGIRGYVGGNTLMEMGLAFYLKKKIYLLNEIPIISYKEEIIGMRPVLLAGKLPSICLE